jgi:hypothetical protein
MPPLAPDPQTPVKTRPRRVHIPHSLRRAARPDDLQRLRGLVRDIGEEARDLAIPLNSIATALGVADSAARLQAVTEQLAELKRATDEDSKIVDDRIVKLTVLFEADDALYDDCGDEILTIGNEWARALAELPKQYKLADHVAFEAAITTAAKTLADVIWHVALVTIPGRVNQHLATISVGGRLDFAAMFSDELPDPAMQRHLLDYLAGHPLFVAGVVDPEAGVIFKASKHLWRRVASYVLILSLAIPVGVGFVDVITNGLPAMGIGAGWLGIATSRFGELLPAYGFLLVGSVLHIGVEAIKQGQRTTIGGFTAMGEWLAWIHVHELAILAGIVVVWLTLVGLAISLPPNQLTWQTALFAGYGIDSVFGLFVTRFDTTASGALAKLTPSLLGKS